MSDPGLTNLMAWLDLDEESGVRYDNYIHGNDASPVGDVGYVAGKNGNAADFEKANDELLVIPDNDYISAPGAGLSFTVGLWFKVDAISVGTQYLASKFSHTTASKREWRIYVRSDNRVCFHVSDTTSSYGPCYTSGTISAGVWYFAIARWDGVGKDQYISINAGTEGSWFGPTNGVTNRAADLVFGGVDDNTTTYLDGSIDGFVYYNRLLTLAERQWLYNSGSGRTIQDVFPTYHLDAENITTTPVAGTPTVFHAPLKQYPGVPPPPSVDTPVYILDPDSLDIIGMIEDYYSLIWTERYYEAGEFELEVPIEYDEHAYLAFGNLLYVKQSNRLMIVEDIKPSVSEEKAVLLVKGQSAESYLKRRVLLDPLNVDGIAESIVYFLIDQNLTDADDTDRNISILKTTFPTVSTTIEFEDQLEMQSVYDAVVKICKTSYLGFRLEKEAGSLAFSIYEGEDRSYDQAVNSYVIFSDNFDNVVSSSFYLSEKEKINVVLVATTVIDQYGDEEWAPTLDRVFVWSASEPTDVDRYETVLETEVKRTINPNPPPLVEEPKIPDDPVLGIAGKVVLSAVGITTTPTVGVNNNEPVEPEPEPETPLTDSEVLAIISTRGTEILDTWKSVGLFEGDFDIHGNFQYGTDFFMGDIVQCNLEGRNVKARIIELVRSYSVEGVKSYVAFDFII